MPATRPAGKLTAAPNPHCALAFEANYALNGVTDREFPHKHETQDQ
jgi:hypothetical protein